MKNNSHIKLLILFLLRKLLINYFSGMKRILFIAAVLISFVTTAQTKLFPVEIKGKFGYMDQTGKMVISPMYDYADDFSEDLAVVALHNLPCVIDQKNVRVIDTSLYQFIGAFSEGLASVIDFKKKKFYINTKGEKVISLPDNIYEGRKFKDGLACVSKEIDEHSQKFNHDIVTLGYRFGFIDKRGKQVIDFVYEDASNFSQGIARVKVKNLFGIINKNGEIILKPSYKNIGNFFEGKAVINDNGRFGFIDLNGKVIIKPEFDMAFDFSEGLAAIYNNQTKKYGFINEKGELSIKDEYDGVRPFSEGKAAILNNGKWGFIDKNGKLVLLNVFDNASVFDEGMCAVLIKRKWGFIDSTGHVVIPLEYDAVGSFDDGIADVVYHGISLYIDKRGNILPRLNEK